MSDTRELQNIASEIHRLNATMKALLQEMQQLKGWVAQGASRRVA
jgi:NADH:ubiquinone oxidoreductase subunit E